MYLLVDKNGVIKMEVLKVVFIDEMILVFIMGVNNEVGSI